MTPTSARRGTLVAGIVVGLSLLVGCAGSPATTPTGPATSGAARTDAIIAIEAEPVGGFDPTQGWGHGTTPLIQSTLVAHDADMAIVKDLATDYEIGADGLTLTFTLRTDARFTDGQPVTASDVVFTFKTAAGRQTSLDLTFMKDVQATGDHEVTFTLTAPNSSFIDTIAFVGIVPEHAYGAGYEAAPIGSGPWKLKQWNKGESVILEANADYYGTAPKLKDVTILFMKEDAAFAAAQARKVDVALTSASHALQKINGMRLEVVKTQDNRGLTLPMSPDEGKKTESGHPIGNDVTSSKALRQAIAYAVDRDMIAQSAVNGFATPAYSENDGAPWNNPEVRIEHDVNRAKKLLADDGWSDTDGDGILDKGGLKAEFTALYPAGDSTRQAIGMATAQQVEQIGIKMNVIGKSWDEIAQEMFANGVIMGWGSSSPYTSYLLHHSTNMLKDDYYNPEGFSNATVDGYLDAALHATSIEEANQQWRLAQWDGSTGTSMKGDVPWVWLVNLNHLYYVTDGLDIGRQSLHAHGASWTLLENLEEWSWS